MKKIAILLVCFLVFSSVFSMKADALKENISKVPNQTKKQTKTLANANLINDPNFSLFNQQERNSWVYAIDGGKNVNYKHMPLIPSQGGVTIFQMGQEILLSAMWNKQILTEKKG